MKQLQLSMLLSSLAVLMAACSGTQVPPYGIREGQLPPCADHRTCMSSHPEEQEESRVEHLRYEGTRREGRTAMAAVIQGFPGARIVSSHRSYLRVEFTGAILREGEEFFFETDSVVDEMEFYFPPQRSVIHVRVAARSGPLDKERSQDRFDALQTLLEEFQERIGSSSLRL
ncbi:uncharacterized protein (DUF1499 family) [Natronospira proteinivora]|uniref:Uncharacterized protein (DUF1499 family) n=1 Tax=Natronospira proteinivora TaxID=1807133 RepID=A0ABT1G9I7_9GAMM|nr:DUF1499 domain-containing protein [Natronospira proteinivora]MCP1726953.1 uncharacterized protein (DUF1499 family) [Natronospira proteinivora]